MSPAVTLAVAVAWTLLALGVSAAVFGGPAETSLTFPDEVYTARGAALVAERGLPAAPAPLDDPGDLARMRMWVANDAGEHVPPSMLLPALVHGLPRALPGGGWLAWLVVASGVGAIGVLGVRLARPGWRWLGALAPAIAFPATYWLLRPWQNVALEVTLALWAAVLVERSVATPRDRRGVGPSFPATGAASAALALAVLAALVRPDHVLLLLVPTLVWLAAVDQRPRRWQRWVTIGLVTSAVWGGGMLLSNLAMTGDALASPVDLRRWPEGVGAVGRDLPFPLPPLLLVLAPQGLPSPAMLVEQVGRYWFMLGATGVVSGVALVVTVVGRGRRPSLDSSAGRKVVARWRRLRAAAWSTGVVACWHVVTRVSDTDLGAAAPAPGLVHSHPRYTALVYVAVALVAVVGVSRLPRAWLRRAAAVALLVAAVAGAVEVLLAPMHEEGLLAVQRRLDQASAYATAVDEQLPSDAIVYSRWADTIVWEARPVGRLQDERIVPGAGPLAAERAAASFDAALEAGFQPYVLQLEDAMRLVLTDAVRERGLDLETTVVELPRVIGIADAPVVRVVRTAEARSPG